MWDFLSNFILILEYRIILLIAPKFWSAVGVTPSLFFVIKILLYLMCNCKSCHSKQLLKNHYIRILKSLLLNNNWSPKGLLLFQILVSFSLLKVTFDGLLDTFPPWISQTSLSLINNLKNKPYSGLEMRFLRFQMRVKGPKIIYNDILGPY